MLSYKYQLLGFILSLVFILKVSCKTLSLVKGLTTQCAVTGARTVSTRGSRQVGVVYVHVPSIEQK